MLNLRDELASNPIEGSDLSHPKSQKPDHLDGVINGNLRLYQMASMGLSQLTPPEGLTTGETYISSNITVSYPRLI